MRIRFNDVRLPPFGFLYTHTRLRLACADLLTRIRIPLQSAGVLYRPAGVALPGPGSTLTTLNSTATGLHSYSTPKECHSSQFTYDDSTNPCLQLTSESNLST